MAEPKKKTAPKKSEPPKQSVVLMYNLRGACRLYIDGVCAGSWDKTEPEMHVWGQIARKTDAETCDVVHSDNKHLPERIDTSVDLGVRASPRVSEMQAPVVTRRVGGPTTSYSTGAGPVESLG